MDDILTPLATASPDSMHWAWKYWFVLWNTFDYQFCIVGHTNSSFRPDHAAIVASVPLRGIHHTKKSHKSSRVEHFYVLQRCIPYINTLGKETKIKTIITRIKKKKNTDDQFYFSQVPQEEMKDKNRSPNVIFTSVTVRPYCLPMWAKPFIRSGQPLIRNSCFQLFID